MAKYTYTEQHRENMRKAQQQRRERESIGKPKKIALPVGRPLKRNDPNLIRLIMYLKSKGLSSRKIALAIATHGYDLGYVTISKIIKDESQKR